MRVLFAIHELALNGAVTALLQQVRRMTARGDAVSIMTPALEGPAAALLPRFQEAGASIVQEIVAGAQDIVVGCTIFAVQTMHACAGKIPTAWWIHEGRAGVTALAPSGPAIQTLHRVNKLIFPNRIVAEELWRPLVTGLPPNRIDIVPCFVPQPALVEPRPRRPGRARVICVGSVYPRKRQADLVQAVSMLGDAPIDCILVGHMHSIPDQARTIIQSDPERFILAGGQAPETLPGWYRSADIFCLPSEDECMPLAPIEAAWHDIPVILADLECYRDTWRHGCNALIHPVGDVEMLAWYLRMMMESPSLRRRLTLAAREVPLRFSEARSAALFDAALADAVASFRAG